MSIIVTMPETSTTSATRSKFYGAPKASYICLYCVLKTIVCTIKFLTLLLFGFLLQYLTEDIAQSIFK